MKKFIILISSIAISIVAMSQVPTDSLMAYYPFNGNANDQSGNGYNGSVNGAILTTDRFENENCAYLFNGYNSYISFPAFFNIGIQEYSLSMWILISDTTQNNQTCFNTAPHNGIDIIYNWNYNWNFNEKTIFYCLGMGYFWNYHCLSGIPKYICQNTWHHVVLIKNGINYSIYWDSLLDFSLQADSSYNNFNLLCGFNLGSNTMYYENFDGKIDDVVIYNRALNASEVQELFHDGGWLNEASIVSVLFDRTICINDSTTFEVLAIGIPPINYQWQKDGSDITGATDSILTIYQAQPGNEGYYRCVVSNEFGSDTSNIAHLGVEVVGPTPINGPAYVEPYQIALYSVPYNEEHIYEFMVEGGNIIDMTTNTITVHWGTLGQGYIKLVETSELGCIADTVTYEIIIGYVGVTNWQENAHLFIQPNPLSESGIITVYGFEDEALLTIYDLNGTKVMEKTLFENRMQLDLSRFLPGIYFVRVLDEKMVEVKKIIKP